MAKQAFNPKEKYNKFKNSKVVVDGITFDSRHEANYYGILKYRLKAGEIKSFERQKDFPFVVNGMLVCRYKADFVVTYPDGSIQVIDTKSEFSRKEPVYRIKFKLMQAVYGITIKEIVI